jgi:predicted RNase H-like nuclease (RuvC/YqgF family)
MTTKSMKPKAAAPGHVPALPVEDDERHTHEVEEFVSRNRDALNESITRSRKEVAEGKFSTKTIDDIIVEGRKRHGRDA